MRWYHVAMKEQTRKTNLEIEQESLIMAIEFDSQFNRLIYRDCLCRSEQNKETKDPKIYRKPFNDKRQ